MYDLLLKFDLFLDALDVDSLILNKYLSKP